jgi:hypothetical protein
VDCSEEAVAGLAQLNELLEAEMNFITSGIYTLPYREIREYPYRKIREYPYRKIRECPYRKIIEYQYRQRVSVP